MGGYLSRGGMNTTRSREARRGVLVCYLLQVHGWCSRVWLGTLESSAAWGPSQSLQHKQKTFEARFWWAAVGGKGMGATGHSPWWGSYWVSLSQDRIAFPAPKSCIAPHGQQTQALLSRLPSLKTIFPILHRIFLPMERSRSLYSASFACRGALLNPMILNLNPVPWAGLFAK